jgi:hypothetical protein
MEEAEGVVASVVNELEDCARDTDATEDMASAKSTPAADEEHSKWNCCGIVVA